MPRKKRENGYVTTTPRVLQCAYSLCRKQFTATRSDQRVCPGSAKCKKGFARDQLKGEVKRYESPEQKLHRALWERGELSFLLKEHQKPLWDFLWTKWRDQSCVRANLLCSRGHGKTFLLWIFIETLCRTIPGFTVLFVSPSRQDVKDVMDTVLPNVWETCPPDLQPQLKGYRNKYVFDNGSFISLQGTDVKQGGKFRGKGAHLIVFDEPGQSTINLTELWGSVLFPVIHRKGGKVFYISTPAVTPGHTYFDIQTECSIEGHHLQRTVYDIGYPPEVLEEMARNVSRTFGQQSTQWRREYGCEWITEADRQIVKEWSVEFVQDPPREHRLDARFRFWKRYMGGDPGFRDFTALLFGYYHFPSHRLIIEDEVILRHREREDEIIRARFDKQRELWGDLHLVSEPLLWMDNDSAGQRLAKGMSFAGMPAEATNKEGLEVMVDKVRTWVDHGRILISPRCENLIKCLSKGVWQHQTEQSTGTRKFARLPGLGHLDALSALVYMVRNIDENNNPVPPHFNHNPERQFAVMDQSEYERNAEWDKFLNHTEFF